MQTERQVPIWFFVGGTLLIYGIIIFLTGVYNWLFPPEQPTVALSHLHADVWWGGVLTVLGAIYCLKFHPWREEPPTSCG